MSMEMNKTTGVLLGGIVFTVLFYAFLPTVVSLLVSSPAVVTLANGSTYTPPAPLLSGSFVSILLYSVPILVWIGIAIAFIMKAIKGV